MSDFKRRIGHLLKKTGLDGDRQRVFVVTHKTTPAPGLTFEQWLRRDGTSIEKLMTSEQRQRYKEGRDLVVVVHCEDTPGDTIPNPEDVREDLPPGDG